MTFADSELELSLDLGPAPEAQGWLYKEGDAVRGPVKASVLINHIRDGVLDADSNVSPEFGEWQSLSDIEEFAGVLKKASAALAERKAALQAQQRERKIAMTLIALLAVVGISFFSTGFVGGRYLAQEKPWQDKTDWSTKPPALVSLSEKKIALAKATTTAWDIAAWEPELAPAPTPKSNGSGKSNSKKASPKTKGKSKSTRGKGQHKAAKDKTRDSSAERKAETKVAAAPAQEYNASGLPRALSQQQIMRVLKTKRSAIANCLRNEAKSNPDMPGTVTMEFVVTSAGSPANFKIQERQVREGALANCLRSKIMVLRWPKFFGENKTVKIPFNIKRR